MLRAALDGFFGMADAASELAGRDETNAGFFGPVDNGASANESGDDESYDDDDGDGGGGDDGYDNGYEDQRYAGRPFVRSNGTGGRSAQNGTGDGNTATFESADGWNDDRGRGAGAELFVGSVSAKSGRGNAKSGRAKGSKYAAKALAAEAAVGGDSDDGDGGGGADDYDYDDDDWRVQAPARRQSTKPTTAATAAGRKRKSDCATASRAPVSSPHTGGTGNGRGAKRVKTQHDKGAAQKCSAAAAAAKAAATAAVAVEEIVARKQVLEDLAARQQGERATTSGCESAPGAGESDDMPPMTFSETFPTPDALWTGIHRYLHPAGPRPDRRAAPGAAAAAAASSNTAGASPVFMTFAEAIRVYCPRLDLSGYDAERVAEMHAAYVTACEKLCAEYLLTASGKKSVALARKLVRGAAEKRRAASGEFLWRRQAAPARNSGGFGASAPSGGAAAAAGAEAADAADAAAEAAGVGDESDAVAVLDEKLYVAPIAIYVASHVVYDANVEILRELSDSIDALREYNADIRGMCADPARIFDTGAHGSRETAQ